MSRRSHLRLAAALIVGLAAAPDAAAGHRPITQPYRESIVLRWNNAALEAVRRTRLGPTIVARALAVTHACMYDAWTAYDATAAASLPENTRRRPRRERTLANTRAAVSMAAYRALVDLFPSERPLFDATMAALGYEPSNTSIDPSMPEGIGNLACAAVLAMRHVDGSNQVGDLSGGAPYSDYTHYVPVNTPTLVSDPNRWQPIMFANGQTPGFLTPHWGRVTPFALPRGDAFRPPPPARYPDERYFQQAEAVRRLNAGLTDRRKMISEYWSDGPASELPPGHWNLLAHVVSRRDRHALDDDVKLYFALNNALLDASIAVWDCKAQYDSVRPITALRFLFAGQRIQAWGGPFQGTREIDGNDWRPYQPGTFLTPPFAEYVSGHSAFSAAAAEVLKRFTGHDRFHHSVLLAPGSSRIEPGLTPRWWTVLFWPTFSAAADEAGLSRRLGGIHFLDGDLAGRALGRQVGRTVWSRARALFNGG